MRNLFPGPIKCGVNFPHIVCMPAIDGKGSISPPNYDAGRFYISLSYYSKAVLKEYHLKKNKAAFLYEVLHELKKRKVYTIPDKKDFLMYIAKAWMELKHNVI